MINLLTSIVFDMSAGLSKQEEKEEDKFICPHCGSLYDEDILIDDTICPVCGEDVDSGLEEEISELYEVIGEMKEQIDSLKEEIENIRKFL